MNPGNSSGSPRVTTMRVIPVAGYDSMLLNLSGAHAPFFTRNLVLLTDDTGHTGAVEVPGGEQIREVLEQSRHLVLGAEIGDRDRVVGCVLSGFAHCDAAGRGMQTFGQRVAVHAAAAIEAALLDLLGQHLGLPVSALLGQGRQRDRVAVLGYLLLSATGARPACRIALAGMNRMTGCGFATRRFSPYPPCCGLPTPPRTGMASRTSSSREAYSPELSRWKP
jgi:L-alanine-DL-glutamate epimerase-like enolase superfamily enzyme